jgi:two-component system cell cycle response regulator
MEQNRKRIVYFDDVYHSLITTKEKLKKHYEVYLVQTLEAMYEVLRKAGPELILLDINMPQIDGFEVIKRLKADIEFKHIPVIFLTARKDRQTITEGMSLGAVDFLVKPVSNADLIETIEYHLEPSKRKAIKPIILSIDDDPSILKTINHLLNDLYTVYTIPGVPNKMMIKDLLKKIKPDLFLLDSHMPNFSGYDLVPIIRETVHHKYTPIIFLTADGTIDNLTAAISTEASDFIVKPIDKAILREKMAFHLKKFMMWRHIRSIKDPTWQ